jgi:hypothetical protein
MKYEIKQDFLILNHEDNIDSQIYEVAAEFLLQKKCNGACAAIQYACQGDS